MSSKDSFPTKESNESVKISPAPSSNSDRSDDARKINNGKTMGDSDDENLSGFDSDSEDESHNHGNGIQKCSKFYKKAH